MDDRATNSKTPIDIAALFPQRPEPRLPPLLPAILEVEGKRFNVRLIDSDNKELHVKKLAK